MEKISVLISKTCFMSCEGCYLSDRNAEELPLGDILKYITKLRDKGLKQITISGGDPLKRPQIAEFLQDLGKLQLVIHLDTTGIGIHRDNPELLRAIRTNVTLLGIAFDGSTDNINNIFRTNSTFSTTEKQDLLGLLSDYQIPVAIKTVAHRGNLADLQNIHDIINKYPNIERWEIHQFAPITTRAIDFDKYIVSLPSFEGAVSKIKTNGRIVVHAKPNTRKTDFNYINWNGDIIYSGKNGLNILGNIQY